MKVKLPDSSFEVTESPNILINFINVHKRFIQEKKETVILKDFSFKLMRGNKIGIIGKNGSGKSTFLNLNQKNCPNQGNIKIKKK